jgi:hypothetical protein
VPPLLFSTVSLTLPGVSFFPLLVHEPPLALPLLLMCSDRLGMLELLHVVLRLPEIGSHIDRERILH